MISFDRLRLIQIRSDSIFCDWICYAKHLFGVKKRNIVALRYDLFCCDPMGYDLIQCDWILHDRIASDRTRLNKI